MTGAERVALRGRHLIGRDPARCDLHLSTSHISGVHAELRWEERGWCVVDLASRNGTYVDGERLGPGAERVLREGATLGFGGARAAWTLADARPPRAFAVSLDSGACEEAEEGVLELPQSTGCDAAVYRGGAVEWLVERAGGQAVIRDGEVLNLAERWRVFLPGRIERTLTLDDAWSLERLTLAFLVSRDEEDIVLRLQERDRCLELPHRSHHSLLLALARERLRDRDNAALTGGSQGWLDRELLLSRLKISIATLDQQVHRARQHFQQLEIHGARRLIERRRGSGALRIGAARLDVRAG